MDRYGTSKLIVVLVARELAERLQESSSSGKDSDVIINTLHPGFCRTELFRHAPFPLDYFLACSLFLLGRTPEMGSRTLVAAASAGKETHGRYLDSCKLFDESPFARSEEGVRTQKRLYAELVDILEGVQPGVTKLV